MSDIKIYRLKGNIGQFPVVQSMKQRDWMNKNPHAYRCVPMSIANTFGWDVILPETVTLEWNGGIGQHDVKVLKGTCFNPHFGSGTVTMQGSYTWETEEGMQLMVMPVPNQDQWDLVSLSAIIETDRLMYPWFLTCQLTRPGTFTFRQGMKLARVIPIRVEDVVNANITIENEPEDFREYRLWQTQSRNEFNENKPPHEKWQKFYHKVARWTKVITPKILSR